MGQAVGEKRTFRRRTGPRERWQALAQKLAQTGADRLALARRRLRPWLSTLGWLAGAVLAGAASLPFGGTAQMAPFGLALALAVRPQRAFLCCVGCALGGFFTLPVPAAVQQTAAALAVAALRTLARHRATVLPALAAVAVSGAICQGFGTLGSGGGVAVWLPQSCLVLALWLLGRQAADLRPDTAQGQATLLAVWTSTLCCLGCLPGQLPWLGMATGTATLCAAAVGTAGLPALLWAGGALATLLLRQDAAPLLVAIPAGWVAGLTLRRGGGRAAVSGAYFITGLLAVFAARDLSQLGWLLAANGGAVLSWRLIPDRLLQPLALRLDTGEGSAATPAAALDAMARGLAAVAAGIEAVGRTAEPFPTADDPDQPIQAACRQVCGGCKQKAHCWGAGYDTTQTVLQEFLRTWRQDCTGEFAPHFCCIRLGTLRSALLQAERLRVLRTAGQVEHGVLRRAVSDQYRALAAGLADLADSWQPQAPQPGWAGRITALAAGLQLPMRRITALRNADGSPSITLTLRPVQLGQGGLQTLAAEIGRICGVPLTGTELPGPDDQLQLLFTPAPVCRARAGAASRSLNGPCGDVTEVLPLGDDLHLLLCDGMGTGRTAAMDAKMTALFTARLLRAGFSADTAARLVNAALLTRAPGDRGSTLDLVSFCGRDGSARLYRAGGCGGWLCTGGQLHRLAGGDSLPLGSTETARSICQQLTLAPGDWLVLVSDGALTAGEGPLLRVLQPLTAPDAARLAADLTSTAHRLLEELLAAVPGQDDVTLALLYVEKAG